MSEFINRDRRTFMANTLDHAYRAVDVAPLYEGIARWRADDGG
jgi:hypothetical protein